MSSLTNKHKMSGLTNKQTNITCPLEQTNNPNIWLRLLLAVYQTRTRGGENILCQVGLHTTERGHQGDLDRGTAASPLRDVARGSRSVCSIGRQLDLASVVWQQSTGEENKTLYYSSRLRLNWSLYCSRLFGICEGGKKKLKRSVWAKQGGRLPTSERAIATAFGPPSLGQFGSRFCSTSLASDSELPVLSLRSDSSRDRTAAKLKILFLGGLRSPCADYSRLSER